MERERFNQNDDDFDQFAKNEAESIDMQDTDTELTQKFQGLMKQRDPYQELLVKELKKLLTNIHNNIIKIIEHENSSSGVDNIAECKAELDQLKTCMIYLMDQAYQEDIMRYHVLFTNVQYNPFILKYVELREHFYALIEFLKAYFAKLPSKAVINTFTAPTPMPVLSINKAELDPDYDHDLQSAIVASMQDYKQVLEKEDDQMVDMLDGFGINETYNVDRLGQLMNNGMGFFSPEKETAPTSIIRPNPFK